LTIQEAIIDKNNKLDIMKILKITRRAHTKSEKKIITKKAGGVAQDIGPEFWENNISKFFIFGRNKIMYKEFLELNKCKIQ
jgi:hypothetical protein